MDRGPNGQMPFNAGFAPGTMRKATLLFVLPIALGFALYGITSRFDTQIEDEAKKSNPRLVPIHHENSKAMFNKVLEDNKKWKDEMKAEWGIKSAPEDPKKDQPKKEEPKK